MEQPELPDELVAGLNDLGFALVDVGEGHVFVRFSSGGEVRLVIQAVSADRWQAEMELKPLGEPGQLLNPAVSALLAQEFRASSCGGTWHLRTAQLVGEFLGVLREAVLAVWDSPPLA